MKYDRKNYKKLAGKPKHPKHNNSKVYACPECWMGIDTNSTCVQQSCICGHCFPVKDIVVFDSKVEHAFGLTLKKKRGIKDLAYHKRWVIRPAEYIMPTIECHPIALDALTFYSTDADGRKNVMVAPAQSYEADFSYTDENGQEIVVDVKGLDRKTGMPRLIGPEFKKKCKRMKLIYRIDVLVYAGGIMWRWDEKLKKLEIKI